MMRSTTALVLAVILLSGPGKITDAEDNTTAANSPAVTNNNGAVSNPAVTNNNGAVSNPAVTNNNGAANSPGTGNNNDTRTGGNGAKPSSSCEARLLVLSLLACAAAKHFNAYISLF